MHCYFEIHVNITSLFQTLFGQSHFGPNNVNSCQTLLSARVGVAAGLVESTPVRLYTTIICIYIIRGCS